MDVYQMIRREEGAKRSAYLDTLGYWTIGVGRLIDARKNGGLSDDEIDYLFKNDVRRVLTELAKALPWFAQLDEVRQAVLAGMAFQMGTAGVLQFANTLKAVSEQRWADAAAGMRASKWAQQTPARAERMAKQMETGQWQT